MENLDSYSNSEILKMIFNLSQNHEKLKNEIILLHQMLLNVEQDYVDLTKELEKRK